MELEERINQELERITALLKVEGDKMVAKDKVAELTESEALMSFEEFSYNLEKLKTEEPQFYAGLRYGLLRGWWQCLSWLQDGMSYDPIFENGLLPLECIIKV
jgi:hypothetical protein